MNIHYECCTSWGGPYKEGQSLCPLNPLSARFENRPVDQLILHKVTVVFLSPSKQMPVHCFKLDHDRSSPRSFQFIIPCRPVQFQFLIAKLTNIDVYPNKITCTQDPPIILTNTDVYPNKITCTQDPPITLTASKINAT